MDPRMPKVAEQIAYWLEQIDNEDDGRVVVALKAHVAWLRQRHYEMSKGE
jgi:hypothetical protein